MCVYTDTQTQLLHTCTLIDYNSHYIDSFKYEAGPGRYINNTDTNYFYCPGLRQTQQSDGVKTVNGIQKFPISFCIHCR